MLVEKFDNSQVTDPICARICARDAVRRTETEEMPTSDTDVPTPLTEVCAASGDRPSGQRRASHGS